jgi:hypothetical protein
LPAKHCHCSGRWQNSPCSRGNCRSLRSLIAASRSLGIGFLQATAATFSPIIKPVNPSPCLATGPRFTCPASATALARATLRTNSSGTFNTTRRWLDHQHRARSSITFLLPSSPSYVFPPRRRAPSPTSLPYLLAAVAPTTPRPVIRSRLPISCPRPLLLSIERPAKT